ncbi:MAG: CoA transferase [Gammaproteobacteria bacterium]|nr:CoA transferase [Gammaproteobacteria bacterium]MCP5201816.1 CoA transferase [Gammaproteobacteria bacterium]
MPQPLEGVHVLDLTNVLAGPYCTMVLADLGAEVTKVEAIPAGDGSRRFAPLINGESYCFAVLNRNKRSLALNLKHPEGRAIATQLAARADIVVENFRPGVAARLGLDYAAVRALNPAVIHASISGFGHTGPYAHKGGFDIVAQGMSGIMMMTGHPGGRPAKVGIAMNDVAAGATALWAILGAYIGRLRHGHGRHVETSLLEAGLAWTFWEAGAWFGAGEEPTATGTRHRRSAPYQAFRTADGYVTVGANGDKLWRAFCTEVCARPEWLSDVRFHDVESRLAHVDELEAAIESVFMAAPTAHWVERLDRAGVPGGPVYTYAQALADPQVRARAMVVEVDHPAIGPMNLLGVPVKSGDALATIRSPAPWLGQHSAATLAALGYDDDACARLFAAGVVHDARRPA